MNYLQQAAVNNVAEENVNFLDKVAYGTIGAVTSGVLGIWNTGVALANTVKSEDSQFDQVDTADAIGRVSGQQAKSYYEQNSTLIDVVGLVGSSFVPGGLATSGVRALRSGKVVSSFANLGLENGIAGKYVGQAIEVAKRGDPKERMAAISAARWKTIAGAGGDALVDNTVASIAILAAVNQNPILNQNGDLSYFESFGHNFNEFVNPLSGSVSGIFFGADWAFRSAASLGRLSKQVGIIEALRRADQVVSDPGKLNILQGDKALVFANAAQVKEWAWKELEGALGPIRPNGDEATRIKDLKAAQKEAELKFNGVLSEMIGAADPELKGLLDKVTVGKPIEELSNIFSGVNKIRRLRGEDILSGNTGAPVPNVDILDDFDYKELSGRFPGIENSLGAWSPVGFGDPEFGALPIPGIIMRKVEYFQKMFPNMSAEDRQMSTFMHELGHNRSDSLGKIFVRNGVPQLNARVIGEAVKAKGIRNKSLFATTGKKESGSLIEGISNKTLLSLAEETEQLSRIRRAHSWEELDYLKLTLENPNLDSVSRIKLEERIAKKESYLYDPKELFADAYAVLAQDGIRGHQIAALAPSMYNLFKKHGVLFEQLTARKVIYDSVTGDFIKGKTLSQVGDFGNVRLSSKGDSLLFGTNQSVAIREFDPYKMTAQEADAQWAAWEMMGRDKRFDHKFETLESDNLPQVQAWLNKMQREHGDEASNQFAEIGYGQETIEMSFGEILEGFNKDKKSRLDIFKEKTADSRLVTGSEENIQGIARKFNVNEEFVYFGNASDKAMSSIYGAFDPTQPRHATLVAHKTVAFDDVKARSFLNLQNRIQLAADQGKAVAAQVLGEEAAGIISMAGSEALPEAGKVLDVGTTSSTRGIIFAMNAALGSFQAKAQAVGKQIQTAISVRHRAIEKDMGDTFYGVINNKAALIEVNTLIATEFRGGTKWTHFNNLTAEEQDIARFLVSDGGEQFMVNRDLINEAIKIAYSKKSAAASDGTPNFQAIADKLREKFSDRSTLVIKSEDASKSLAWLERYTQQMSKQTLQIANAAGRAMKWELDSLYVPPPDVSHYTHVAFVSQKVPDGIFAGNERGVILASSGDELAKKIALYKQNFGDESVNVATKDEVIAYKKAQSEYDADKMIKERTFDSQLRRTGALTTNLVRSDTLELEHIQNWLKSLAGQNVRNATGLAFAQEIAELSQMSSLYGSASSSKWAGLSRVFRAEGNDPWQATIDTLLNKNDYGKSAPVWKALSETLDSGFTAILAPLFSAMKRNPTVDELAKVNNEMVSRGYSPPYETVADLALANTRAPTKLLTSLVTKSNAVTSFFMLGVDTLAAITNAISLPVLLVPELVASKKLLTDPNFMEKFGVLSPEGTTYPTSGKAITKAIGALFSDKGAMERYRNWGFVGEEISVMRQAMGELELPSNAFSGMESSLWKTADEKASKAVQLARTVSGVDYAENAVRFIAAHVAEQMADAARITDGGERLALINTVLNRVHGNYTAAQRPLLFQGVIGQAIGLFQTYQFNTMQQIFRNWGEGNKKAVAIMAGLQGSLFGVRGIPGYDVMSTHAIGESNPDNNDLTSFLYSSFGDSRDPIVNRRLADWFVYGLPSNFFHLDIYNRGDLNPRNATLVPTSISEIPAFNIGTRFFQNIGNMATAVSAGGMNGNVLMEGLAHNALNRPLAGLATQMLGYRTTTQGNKLLFAQDEENKILSWSAALVGGKPVDEAIALDTLYRKVGYDSARTEELSNLAAGYRASIRAGDMPDTVDLLRKYQQRGGRIETFNKWFTTTIQEANEGQLKKIIDDSNTPAARNARDIIGTDRSLALYRMPGDPLAAFAQTNEGEENVQSAQ